MYSVPPQSPNDAIFVRGGMTPASWSDIVAMFAPDPHPPLREYRDNAAAHGSLPIVQVATERNETHTNAIAAARRSGPSLNAAAARPTAKAPLSNNSTQIGIKNRCSTCRQ